MLTSAGLPTNQNDVFGRQTSQPLILDDQVEATFWYLDVKITERNGKLKSMDNEDEEPGGVESKCYKSC